MIRDVIPPRPAGPDRHPASASAGLAGSATSPTYTTCAYVQYGEYSVQTPEKKNSVKILA